MLQSMSRRWSRSSRRHLETSQLGHSNRSMRYKCFNNSIVAPTAESATCKISSSLSRPLAMSTNSHASQEQLGSRSVECTDL